MSKMRRGGSDLIPVEERRRVITVDGRRGRRKKGFGIEKVGFILEVLGILIIISIGAAIFLIYSHISKMQEAADKAVVEIRETAEGTYELNWGDVGDADTYYVELSTSTVGGAAILGGGNEEKVLFRSAVEGVSCSLPDLPTDETLVLRIELIKNYRLFGNDKTWKQASTEREIYLGDPVIKDLKCEVDPDTGIASINYSLQEGNSSSIYVVGQDGVRKLLRTVDGSSAELDFNAEEDLWMPEPGNPCTLSVVPGKIMGRKPVAFYGGEAKDMVVTWEDFAARDIHLSLNMVEDCICRLEWDEAEVDFYEVQMREGDSGEWKTLKTAPQNSNHTYTSTRLRPGVNYSFRVTAVVGDYEAVAVSEVCRCEAVVTPMYCTVWPVKDLNVYSTPDRSEKVGTIGILDAQCVVDIQDGMFGIMMGGTTCYIDSDYCMINLAEYLGDLCSYDITNSYNSIFMAHGFEIPGLTGKVINGFEHVRLADGSFLVPLLYPTVAKLQTAIQTAEERGYRLKIYESFRPHIASTYMYRTAKEYQYKTLPEYTYSGEEFYEPGFDLYVQVTDETGVTTTRRKTYWELMNGNNSFGLTDFVSSGVSKHNQGVAMDLTLEELDSRREVAMQDRKSVV